MSKLPLTKAEIEALYKRLGMTMPEKWEPLVAVREDGSVHIDVDDAAVASRIIAVAVEFGARDRSYT